jgi:hypothetical protein
MLSEFSVECAMAKVHTSEAYNHLADEAVQVFGGYGFSEEYPPARMYRDSRIARIYEGTNEICRLYAQRAILRRSWSGRLDLSGAAQDQTGDSLSSVSYDEALGSSSRHLDIANLKNVYQHLVAEVCAEVQRERMFDAENQQLMSSLADIAIEIFATESVFLRIAKGFSNGGVDGMQLYEDLEQIYFVHAVDRIRQETNEILAALFTDLELTEQLRKLDEWLPFPVGLIVYRARVAKVLLQDGGLPVFP